MLLQPRRPGVSSKATPRHRGFAPSGEQGLSYVAAEVEPEIFFILWESSMMPFLLSLSYYYNEYSSLFFWITLTTEEELHSKQYVPGMYKVDMFTTAAVGTGPRVPCPVPRTACVWFSCARIVLQATMPWPRLNGPCRPKAVLDLVPGAWNHAIGYDLGTTWYYMVDCNS